MFSQAAGEALLVWTVRAAMASYLFRIGLGIRHRRLIGSVPKRVDVILWWIGVTAYVAHVICAFQFEHGWSQAAAFDHTASETKRLIGVDRGEGLYVNYVFTVAWIADAIRLYNAMRQARPTNSKVDWTVQGFFAFIVFNATIVFGPPVYRWLGLPVSLALGWAWRRQRMLSRAR